MTAMPRFDRSRACATAGAALIFLWFAWAAWARPLLLPDEGRYVGVAWEMLRSDRWLTPTLDGLPYFHKPPLFYWITVGSLHIFGHHEWVARLASVLGASLGAGALYLFARRWSGARAARAALLALLAQPLWLVAGQFANLDILVAGCVTATILLLAHAVLAERGGRPHLGALAGAWAMAALGVLAKGLIGLALPVMVIAAWLVLLGRWRMLMRMLSWPGMALFFAITAPWFIAMQHKFPGFLHYFFVVQHFDRFTQGGFNNTMPFWFYPAVLSGCFALWLPWMVRALASDNTAQESQRCVQLLMRVWPVVIVVFFSLPHSKLLGYILPAVPPLTALAAEGFVSRDAAQPFFSRLWMCSAGIGFLLTLGLLTWLAVHPGKSSEPLAQALLSRRGIDEPVVIVGQYPFDLPFYARLAAPLSVVDQWDAPDLSAHDTPRKEIADAGSFDAHLAAALLLAPDAFPGALCRHRVTWVVGAPSAEKRYPFLQLSREVFHDTRVTLWRIDTQDASTFKSLACP